MQLELRVNKNSLSGETLSLFGEMSAKNDNLDVRFSADVVLYFFSVQTAA